MKNNNKGFIAPILLAIIALLVIGGGVYIYQNKKEKVPAVVDTEIQQPGQVQQQTDTKTSPVNTQTDTSNWKTYTNAQYGFEFKYPPGHELDKLDLPILVSGGTVYGGEHSITFGIKDKTFWDMDYNDKLSFTVKFRPNGEIFTPEEYLKNAFPTHSNDAESMPSYTKGIANGRLQKTTFAGHRAIVESPSYLSAGYKTIYLYGSEDNYFILISQGTDAKVLSQILSTFKFTQ